jgi:hypothetical protein
MPGFIKGGGWINRSFTGRPKTRVFWVLTAGWLLVTIPAIKPLWLELDSGFSIMVSEWWFCLLFISPHPVFLGFALWFNLTEKPRTITESIRDPNYDPRNLY